VIPGWTQALQEMVEGEKARIWIPEEQAYKGRPGAPAGTLVFDVELLKILPPPAAAPAPAPTPAPTK
jgi:peptidylprolyl isomerase